MFKEGKTLTCRKTIAVRHNYAVEYMQLLQANVEHDVSFLVFVALVRSGRMHDCAFLAISARRRLEFAHVPPFSCSYLRTIPC